MIVTPAEVLVELGKTTTIADADAAWIDMVQPLVEAAIQDFLQVEIEKKVHTEILPAQQIVEDHDIRISDYERVSSGVVAAVRAVGGLTFLHLKNTPVFYEGLEVREDYSAPFVAPASAFPTTTRLTYGTHYWLDITREQPRMSETGILRRYGRWPGIPRCVKVVYSSGWTDTELNNGFAGAVKMAVILTMALLYKGRERRNNPKLNPDSESIGKYSYSASNPGIVAVANGAIMLPAVAMQLLAKFRSYRYY